MPMAMYDDAHSDEDYNSGAYMMDQHPIIVRHYLRASAICIVGVDLGLALAFYVEIQVVKKPGSSVVCVSFL